MVNLAPVIKAAGLASAISNLFSSNSSVTLGDFEFASLEIPAAMPWGGKQTLVTHRMPGGDRVVEALGSDDAEISWSGIFMGSSATDRARRLDQFRIDGDPQDLYWGDHTLSVVVSSFTARDMAYRTEYQISCVIVEDDSAEAGDAPQSLLGSLMSDVNDAIGSVTGPINEALGQVGSVVGLGSSLNISSTLGAASLAIGVAGPITAGSASAQGLLSTVSGIASQAKTGVATADNAVAPITAAASSTGTFLGASTVPNAISALNNLYTGSAAQTALTSAQGFASRMATNLGLTP